MYYYYVYAYKGDQIRKEFVAYTHKASAQELQRLSSNAYTRLRFLLFQ